MVRISKFQSSVVLVFVAVGAELLMEELLGSSIVVARKGAVEDLYIRMGCV